MSGRDKWKHGTPCHPFAVHIPEPSWQLSFLIFFFFLSRTEVNAKAVNLCSVLRARLLRDALFLKAGLLLTVFEELSSVCKAGWEPSLTHSATV